MSNNSITFLEFLTSAELILDTYLAKIGSYIELIPGGPIIVRYIRSSHKDDPIRTLLEIILVIFALRYFTTSRNERNKKGFVKLSAAEVEELVDEWEPEPLVLPLKDEERWKLTTLPIVKNSISSHVQTTNGEDLINLASLNFLNLGVHPQVKAESCKIVQQNGVGACGPPNFYGNQDIHIKLENDLKDFFNVEGAVLYGQDFTTAGSVLPSFLKRGDFVIADSGVNLSIQKALQLSRANIYYYNHNDLDHLQEILEDLQKQFFQNEKPISRKFIVSEGLFANYGDSPNLPRLLELKDRFKFRLFLDESLSLGVLGKTGRGLTEHYNLPRTKVEIIIGSMATSFSSSGAFCIGDSVMSYHQRIGSLAYCFSASLPAYVAKATSIALSLIDEKKDIKGNSILISKLHKNISILYNLISKDSTVLKFFDITSGPHSSIIHLKLSDELRKHFQLPAGGYTGEGSIIGELNKKGISDKFIKPYNQEEILLEKVIEACRVNGVLITKSTFSLAQEKLPLIPHLKICINADSTEEELIKSAQVISKQILKTVGGLNKDDFNELTFI